jgi:hypothetical protein
MSVKRRLREDDIVYLDIKSSELHFSSLALIVGEAFNGAVALRLHTGDGDYFGTLPEKYRDYDYTGPNSTVYEDNTIRIRK